MNIDFLQIALLFLIILLTVFLTVTGFQVFLILRDLKKALDRFNKVTQEGGVITKDSKKPITAPKPRRFYKKTL